MKVLEFSDAAAISNYYDGLYAVGYMDAVDADKIDRIADLLRDAGLSAGQRVLDFGCGVGNLTAALAARFPGTHFCGCDISPFAVKRAAAASPDIEFFELWESDLQAHAGAFDFVISHHVLEHVADPRASAREIAAVTTPQAVMIHVLPSGNAGSMEHKIASLYFNGVQSVRGNRFFFEDPSHLRRFTSQQLAELFAPHGFAVADALFANQRWGAVQWITDGDPRVPFILFRPFAWDARDGLQIAHMLTWTTLLTLARAPLRLVRELIAAARRIRRGQGRTRTRRKALALTVMLPVVVPLLPPSFLVDACVRLMARMEWARKNRELGGSEMYVVLRR